jgi:hypothetical protein
MEAILNPNTWPPMLYTLLGWLLVSVCGAMLTGIGGTYKLNRGELLFSGLLLFCVTLPVVINAVVWFIPIPYLLTGMLWFEGVVGAIVTIFLIYATVRKDTTDRDSLVITFGVVPSCWAGLLGFVFRDRLANAIGYIVPQLYSVPGGFVLLALAILALFLFVWYRRIPDVEYLWYRR